MFGKQILTSIIKMVYLINVSIKTEFVLIYTVLFILKKTLYVNFYCVYMANYSFCVEAFMKFKCTTTRQGVFCTCENNKGDSSDNGFSWLKNN